jgi:hypothetical protein
MTDDHPGVVAATDILAYVDGEAGADVVAHVRSCPTCLAEARAQADLQQSLRRALYRFDCPSPQTIGEYELDLLPMDCRVETAQHLLACAECAAELRSLRAFLASEPAPAPSPLTRLRRVLARALAAPPNWAAAGVRGVGDGHTFGYEAGDVTITVNPGQDGPGPSGVLGLVLRGDDVEAASGAEVRLFAPDGTVRYATVDDVGNFIFDAVPTGTYDLEVELSDQVVVVPRLQVRPN